MLSLNTLNYIKVNRWLQHKEYNTCPIWFIRNFFIGKTLQRKNSNISSLGVVEEEII